MIPTLTQIREGYRILISSRKRTASGFSQYKGNASQICSTVVEDCWNTKLFYYQTGAGNFAQFWSRDFGICAESLIALGHKDKVLLTLDYALERFARHRKVTTTITPRGKPYDFPKYASDSLPFIIHSLKVADAQHLLKKYQPFLINEIQKYFDNIIDKKTSMVKQKASFSSMKDYAKRKSSTYDNCMAAMLSQELDEINYYNPMHDYDIVGAMKDNLWNGKYFFDDMNKHDIVTGDANTFPYWCGLFTGSVGKKMFKSGLTAMKKAKLDRPFPLKYASARHGVHSFILSELLVKDYETNSVWIHLGLCFLDVLKEYDKKEFKAHMERYTELIEKNKNFLEVFSPEGKPFKRFLYTCEEGMLWASKYLYLKK